MTFVDGIDYVTTSEALKRLGPDITAEMIYDWTRRRLVRPAGRYPAGESIFRWIELADAEATTRLSRQGRKRATGQPGDLPEIDSDVMIAAISGPAPLTDAAQRRKRCTLLDPDGEPCNQTVNDGAPASACRDHVEQIAKWWSGRIQDIRSGKHKNSADARRNQAAAVAAVLRPEFVYYIRIGDRIKIGWTVNLKQRFNTLGGEEILAVEPGGFNLEQMRHKQFGSARIYRNREWFRPEPDLMSHIDMLVKHYGEAQVA